MEYRLGIDLGGTSAKIALVQGKGKIVKEGSVMTAGGPNPRELVERLSKVCLPMIKGKRVKQVGVGVAGDIDFNRGVVRLSPNLKWKNVPLRSLLMKKLRKNIVVDNDANVAAWGIYKTQVPPNVKHVIVVTLGTGVGGGIILDSQVHRGATGTAGEIGHMTMIENGRRCNCGNLGCLETYAGGFYITREVRKQLEQGQGGYLRKIYEGDPDQVTPYTIAQAAKAGDRFALSVWEEVGHILGIALGNLIYVFNPEVVFLTGGVAQAKQLILNPLKKTLMKRSFKVPVKAARIKVAEKAAHIGVVGASLL